MFIRVLSKSKLALFILLLRRIIENPIKGSEDFLRISLITNQYDLTLIYQKICTIYSYKLFSIDIISYENESDSLQVNTFSV